MNENEDWDLVIGPRRSLLDLRLKEVWAYRDLLILFVRRDFVAFYKQTILGPIWFFLQPLFTTAIYVFLFGNLAGISTDGIPQPLFYLAGITAWTYFSECLTKTANVFRENANIFGKVYFPRLIMPLSIIVSNLVKFAVQLFLLVLIIIYYQFQGADFAPTSALFLFPFLVLLMAAQGLGFGMIISAMTTKYRDLALLLTFGIQLLMYTTPVVFPLSTLSGKMKLIIEANPMTAIIEGMRLGLFGQGTLHAYNIIYTTVITLIVLLVGIVVYNKVEKSFVDTV